MMKKPITIGLTGGIATGKSTVAAIMKAHGVAVIQADDISKQMVSPGTPALKQIETRFGTEMINPDGSLNRKKLGATVFNDTEKRTLLNNILHPLIIEEVFQTVQRLEKAGTVSVIAADIPLLFECGLQKNFDVTLVVTADMETRLKRIMQRDGLSKMQAQKRIDAQMSCSEKVKQADYVIDNSGGLDTLSEKTLEALKKILK